MTPALLLALVVALAPLASAQRRAETQRGAHAEAPRPTRSSTQQARPRLVLLIAVDQFRYDYLERFGDLFAANGLRRLQREGASWTEANYDHVPTETGPGHATMLTGAWPAETGIISNVWHDRATNRSVENVEDTSVRRLGGADPDPPASPHNLLCSTVGDELKLATNNRSKVIGVSFKNRAAILPAGRSADAAYWFSTQTGEFVSSTYYFDRLPDWVARFDAAHPANKYLGAKWERLLPAAEYESHAGRDDAPWERGESNTHYTFPHVIGENLSAPGPKLYEDLAYSPFTNDLLVSFAEAAIANEHLGEDADTDVLTVSFSSNDYVGHRYGPYSQELMDMTVRVDRQIGQLLDYVDAHVGLRNTVVVFTADHGVAPVPEHAASQRLPGGRIKIADVLTAVKNRLRARFAKPGEKDTTGDYVQAFSNEEIYFNQFALERDGVRAEDAERVAGEAALTVPGIARFFTRTQLLTGAVSPNDATARRVLHGYNPARSGDVVVIPEAYKYLSDGFIVASHGGPYTYDTHVPLVIMGGGLAPGRYLNAATPADIAPTLARILNIQAPSNSMGRVLSEAFR
ncbi:MAG TPA: alkaline phosphatase family protein [Pyrinomonadaceae bacterium]|nr:alkaline phosphatase family protein [Pyrinomonadaceae bacterium]